MKKSLSHRLLQVAVSIMALNAILGGGLYLLSGLKGVAFVGIHLSFDDTHPSWSAVDYIFRALAGIWFALGFMFAYMVPEIQKHTIWFRFACLAIFLMGVGRLLSVLNFGPGTSPIFAMVLEFVFPPLLALWQSRVAKHLMEPNHF